MPVDWSRPGGDRIDVAVARRRADDQAHRVGTLFYLPGGPGGSGVSAILGGIPLSADLTARFDVVSYDPRGVGRSHPIQCDANLVNANVNTIPFDPSDPSVYRNLVAFNAKLGADCREHTGPLLDHVGMVDVARDLDALRAALGEDRISLYGLSYGTFTGQMYAENFPQHIRALALDGVIDHSQRGTAYQPNWAHLAGQLRMLADQPAVSGARQGIGHTAVELADDPGVSFCSDWRTDFAPVWRRPSTGT
ncbi:alpha/beta fold hydrolase [Solihabitans fulvus]|uniref:alpha/beta fold hydrolase n=1 Tax=Solihabitans fulvus TaxID=1892852 RepID=UPI001661D5CF|nr:alpha/beta fold hydrolase [Solihabitans fulvus]